MPATRILFAAIALLGALECASGGVLQPASGPPFDAQLIGIGGEGEMRFKSASEPAKEWSLKPAELVAWGAPAEWTRGQAIVLVDGSVIVQAPPRATDLPEARPRIVIDGERLIATPSQLGSLSLPLELVRGVILKLPSNAQAADQRLYSLLAPQVPSEPAAERDRLWLENGDEVSGRLDGLNDAKVQLKTDVGQVEIDRSRVAALLFNPSLLSAVKHPPRRWLVGLSDGSLVHVAALEASDGQVRSTPAVARDLGDWTCKLDSIVFVQPLGAGRVYLSDLSVESYRHLPFLSLTWPYYLDRNATGTRLRSDGRPFAKGVGMHSTSRLTFRLDKPYRRFEAALAIDDHTAGRGSVVFRVYVDGEQRFASDIVRGGQKAVPISIDVSGGAQLSLIVDYADGGDVLDRADWLDARLLSEP